MEFAYYKLVSLTWLENGAICCFCSTDGLCCCCCLCSCCCLCNCCCLCKCWSWWALMFSLDCWFGLCCPFRAFAPACCWRFSGRGRGGPCRRWPTTPTGTKPSFCWLSALGIGAVWPGSAGFLSLFGGPGNTRPEDENICFTSRWAST